MEGNGSRRVWNNKVFKQEIMNFQQVYRKNRQNEGIIEEIIYKSKTPLEYLAKQKIITPQSYEGAIPDDYRAKLSYYLACVNTCFSIERYGDYLFKEQFMDYKNYRNFTYDDIEKLTWLCFKYSPKHLKDKCFFKDKQLCDGWKAKFYTYENGKDKYICGKIRTVSHFLAYTEEWVEKYWETPLQCAVSVFKE